MNALLIYPEFPDTFWSFKHALKFVRKRASLPPLGLLTVAALLPDGWSKRLVDLNVRRLTNQDLEWADIALIGGMIVQKESARRIIARCKQAGLRVVAGGPLFSHDQDSFEGVDHFVLNEAELTLPPFLEDLEKGQARRLYETSEFPNVHESPAPLWELADLDRYVSMSIQYSRGCPFDCEFCNVTALFGRRPRTKTPEQITSELDGLIELGWRGRVFFVDDNLIGHKGHLKKELLPSLREWQGRRRGIPFFTEASINLADDAGLMKAMVVAGFDTVFVGIETPEEAGLAECNKRQNTRRDLVQDVKKIQRAGLQVQGGFIVGFDSDTPSIFQSQIDFIQNSGIVTAMVGILQAPPGTKLYERMKREKRLMGSASADMDGTTNIIPRMDLGALMEGYRQVLAHIYAPEHFYQRVRTFLREYKRPVVRTPFRMGDILISLRTTWHLGLVGKERFHFWRLLGWTMMRRPALLPVAITLAINGHHYRKVFELHVL